MISLKIPVFKYDSETVLQNVDLNFETGKIYGIIGLNGAGKTTLFNLLSGQLKGEDCKITKNGDPISRKEISHIDTDPFFFKNLTAKEFLSVFKSIHADYDEQKLAELLKIDLSQLIEEYSTGMKKKLLLLSQIKQNKSIFILDEPFNGLDLETNKVLEVIIRILSERGKTILLSSHIIEPLLNICDSIHFLKHKSVYKTYEPADFDKIEKEVFGEFTQTMAMQLKEIL